MTRKQEKEMWQIYWRLRFNPLKTCTEEERGLYSKAGYLLHNTKYKNNKRGSGLLADTFIKEINKYYGLPQKNN